MKAQPNSARSTIGISASVVRSTNPGGMLLVLGIRCWTGSVHVQAVQVRDLPTDAAVAPIPAGIGKAAATD
jgi:hypothetical protein